MDGGHLNLLNKNLNNLKQQQEKQSKQKNIFCFCKFCGYRYIILLITTLCLTSICSNMIVFNFTLILMKRPNWEIYQLLYPILQLKLKKKLVLFLFLMKHILYLKMCLIVKQRKLNYNMLYVYLILIFNNFTDQRVF
uniref:Uncharacterized protein n=1 Tax=Meloidogyne enterolobii TaxID=390850 RepID=A0A6V7VQM5_MELEN|nr:unnamed protein product [Meloidogyne enterolobii]